MGGESSNTLKLAGGQLATVRVALGSLVTTAREHTLAPQLRAETVLTTPLEGVLSERAIYEFFLMN